MLTERYLQSTQNALYNAQRHYLCVYHPRSPSSALLQRCKFIITRSSLGAGKYEAGFRFNYIYSTTNVAYAKYWHFVKCHVFRNCFHSTYNNNNRITNKMQQSRKALLIRSKNYFRKLCLFLVFSNGDHQTNSKRATHISLQTKWNLCMKPHWISVRSSLL